MLPVLTSRAGPDVRARSIMLHIAHAKYMLPLTYTHY